MSTYYISKERFWIVVTGGYCGINPSNKTTKPVTGSNALVIIELGVIINIHIIIISDHCHVQWNVYIQNYKSYMKI